MCFTGQRVEAIYPGAPTIGMSDMPAWEKAVVRFDHFPLNGNNLLEVAWEWSDTVCKLFTGYCTLPYNKVKLLQGVGAGQLCDEILFELREEKKILNLSGASAEEIAASEARRIRPYVGDDPYGDKDDEEENMTMIYTFLILGFLFIMGLLYQCAASGVNTEEVLDKYNKKRIAYIAQVRANIKESFGMDEALEDFDEVSQKGKRKNSKVKNKVSPGEVGSHGEMDDMKISYQSKWDLPKNNDLLPYPFYEDPFYKPRVLTKPESGQPQYYDENLRMYFKKEDFYDLDICDIEGIEARKNELKLIDDDKKADRAEQNYRVAQLAVFKEEKAKYDFYKSISDKAEEYRKNCPEEVRLEKARISLLTNVEFVEARKFKHRDAWTASSAEQKARAQMIPIAPRNIQVPRDPGILTEKKYYITEEGKRMRDLYYENLNKSDTHAKSFGGKKQIPQSYSAESHSAQSHSAQGFLGSHVSDNHASSRHTIDGKYGGARPGSPPGQTYGVNRNQHIGVGGTPQKRGGSKGRSSKDRPQSAGALRGTEIRNVHSSNSAYNARSGAVGCREPPGPERPLSARKFYVPPTKPYKDHKLAAFKAERKKEEDVFRPELAALCSSIAQKKFSRRQDNGPPGPGTI